ncbi:ribulose-bisphosphate carboxylase large subunit family protein [Halegenticoccus soli]|uniref:ribulose-bisphosphate carboxylase large subunit family protein n=1 Tax=Halegenticoccus soli TaxID=1985678 RepID=UPI000C6D4FF8|nr:ribulose-bisphosphate carboxylase large subunit family protein [Halegenticoccus soli]
MPNERVEAMYWIETPSGVADAAEAMADEQSSGTFVDVPGETNELRERHGATVERIEERGSTEQPSLPGSISPSNAQSPTYTQAEVVISYPLANIGASLPNLLTTVGGNLFELQELSGIRLVDVDVPDSLAREYPGPQFGIDRTREILDVWERPIIGTIIKPNVGLSPEETADRVETVVEAGVDFVKDDELLANPPYSPVEDRIVEVMSVVDAHRDRTGTEVMYACNITGDVDEMLELSDCITDAGGNCVMVSVNSVGLAGVRKLRRECDLPIHGHRNGWGGLSRCPQLGFDYGVFQKLYRLAGVDHLHVNGLRNKFAESNESVVASAQACQTPIVDEDDTAMPVFSSRQWAGQAHDTYEALGNTDLMYLAGGGILGHPDGPAAGVAHIRQGWDAALRGVPLEEYAQTCEELATAIEYYER